MKVSLGKKLVMNQYNKLGLVTVLYNSPEILEDFFFSLSCQVGVDFHLYVIDNSSLPEPLLLSKQLADKYQLPVTFIDNHGDNVGVARGNNQGIVAALNDRCSQIGFINNDLIFNDKHTLKGLSLALNDFDLVTPKIYAYPKGDVWFEEGYFDLIRGTTPHVINQGNKHFIPYAPTCFLFCKSEIFDVCGVMDEWYFAYYDDADFLYRAMSFGYKLGFIKSITIHHKVSTSTGGSYSDFSLYYGTRNRIYFIRKNLKSIIPLLFTLSTRFIVIPKIKISQYKILFKAIFDGLSAKVK
ncbi:glycosyltransferase family 2 protein [Shewanella sp.]|uniref:glycosyltransferase family 2 protein n=1 Tax=Shewanella sp. TaxID=50422 RepID=UPI004047F194